MGQEQIKSKPRPETIAPVAQISDLRGAVRGPVYTPDDPGYDENRAAWNWDATGFPSAIVTVQDIADIQAVLKFGQEHKLDLCIAGGRHSHLCMANDSLVLDMSQMKKIEIDPETKQVVAQAGVKLGELDAETERHGLVVPAGHNSDTGIAGLTLGGGVGYLVRLYGLTIDSLLRVRLITADGEYITADKETNSDLFWALRGGGGNFGVVVDFTFQAYSIPSQVMGGALVFPNVPMLSFLLNDPPSIAKKVRDYWVTMPNEVGATMTMPIGGPLVTVWCHVGSEEEGAKEFAKWDFSSTINTVRPMSYQTGVQRLLDKQQPAGFHWERGCLLNELSDEVIDCLWKQAHEAPPGVKGAFVIVALGGKMGDIPSDATAFEQRQAKYWLLMIGSWENYQEKPTVVDFIRKVASLMVPYASGSYAPVINAPETDDGNAVFSDNIERLVAIKAKYDPNNFFHYNRNIAKTK